MDIDESILENDNVFRYLRSLALCNMVVCFDLNNKPDCKTTGSNINESCTSNNNVNDHKKKSQKTVVDELHGETDHCDESNKSKNSKMYNRVNEKTAKMVSSTISINNNNNKLLQK